MIYTIGHSTRTVDELAAMLREVGVDVLVDIRTVPRSRFNPQFNTDALPAPLAEAGIAYKHLAALGGLRHRPKDAPPSPNGAWRNEAFRNYADYALTPAFRAGLGDLLGLARTHTPAIMCAEAVWSEDPVSFDAKVIPAVIDQMRMMPKPEKPIPIWIGGSSEPAIQRALRLDGWHGSRTTPEEAAPIVQRLRAARPDPGFAISLRAAWDGRDDGALKARLQAYQAAGVGHVLVEPFDRTIDDWLRSVERIAHAGEGVQGGR